MFIGPDKTGSTWLYEVLRRHPRCYVPPIKDIYFFDRHYDRGIDWYLGFFAKAGPEALAIGELSHDYLFSALAAERIARDLPHIRLLTCLRDPADRMLSHYLYMVRSGRTRLPFAEAVKRFPELIENSRYAKHLSEYLRRFDRERILVLFYDDLQSDARAFAALVFDFIGVPFVESIEYERRVLPASKPRSFALARILKLGANAARRLGLQRLVGRIKHGPASRLLYRAYATGEKPRLGAEDRAQVVDLLRPDIQQLEKALQVDLGRWLQTERSYAPANRGQSEDA